MGYSFQTLAQIAYLLILWCRRDDIIHQDGHQFSYSMHTRCKCAILGCTVYGLSLGFGLVHPFARYRVYDVEYSQLVCARCPFKVGEEFLDEQRFGLSRRVMQKSVDGSAYRRWAAKLIKQRGGARGDILTWTLATQSAVMLVIREPDTPGGLRPSMACRAVSNSATADDMVTTSVRVVGQPRRVEEESEPV